MGPKKKQNSKENELSVSRKKFLDRPSPAAINSGAKTKDNSPRKVSASATTRSVIKPHMQSKIASSSNPISVTKNVKNNDSLNIDSHNQAANSKPQKKQASRIPASNSMAKNRNINAKVQDNKPNKVHSPNKFQSRSSTLPSVHPVAFIKDGSKSFRQSNQSKSRRISSLNNAKMKMNDQPQKTSSFGQTNASDNINSSIKCIQDSNSIDSAGLEFGDIDSNIPVKDLGSVNSKAKLSDDHCNEEDNVSPAIKTDESPIKLSTKKLHSITFNGNIINNGFESLDDLKLENLEAYISACKSSPYSTTTSSFESQSLTPRLKNELIKSSTLKNFQNEIKIESKDELYTEDANTVSTIENCTSELEFNGLEVALPQTYESPSNILKEDSSNSITISPQTLNTFQPHQLDTLGLKWALENKKDWVPNSIDKKYTENLATRVPDREESASSDSDKKTFTWTPEKIISFEMNKMKISKKISENESAVSLNLSPISNKDSLPLLIQSEGNRNEKPSNNITITPTIQPTNFEQAESTKIYTSHTKGDVKRVNEALNKRCSKEFNVDCEMENVVISDTSHLCEAVFVPEVSDEISGDNLELNEPDTADDSSKIEELSTLTDMTADKIEDDSNNVESSTLDLFEDVNTLNLLNVAPTYNLDKCLLNSEEEYLKYIKNELEIIDDDNYIKLNLGDDDEFSVESEEYFVPAGNTDAVWVDYKRQIKPRIQDDSAIDENKYDSWAVDEEDDDYRSSTDGNTILSLESNDKEWIKTEKELVDLKSLLEECSMEVQIAAHEIKNLSSKHVRKIQNSNNICKTKIKKRCDDKPIRNELLEISDLMDNLTQPLCGQEYDVSPSEKLSYNRRIYCHEEDLDYYSMSSSDEDCKIKSTKDESLSPPKKSFLSFGKSCNNKKKKSSKILLSFFNIFK